MAKANMKLLLLLVATCTSKLVSAGKHAFTPLDLVKVRKVNTVAVSPDSQYVLYDINKYIPETNKKENNLFITSLKTKETVQLTATEDAANTPFWLNNNTIAFYSSRSGSSQIWYSQIDFDNLDLIKGDDMVQLTNYHNDVNNVVYNAKANRLFFSAQAYVSNGEMVNEETYVEHEENERTTGMVYDSLFFRHWDTFVRPKVREQLFVADLEFDNGKFNIKKEVNIMKGNKMECPVAPFGDAGDFNVSPDGKYIYFSSRVEDHSQAWNTNTNIYAVRYSVGSKPHSIENLTPKNPGYDTAPRVSPDGKWLAYFEMKTKQFESDVNRLKLYSIHHKTHTEIKLQWDRSPDSLTWSADSTKVYLTAPSFGREKLYVADLTQAIKAIKKNAELPIVVVKELIATGSNSIVEVVPKGELAENEVLILTRNSMMKPNDIYKFEVPAFEQLSVEDETSHVLVEPPKSEENLEQITTANVEFTKNVKVSEPEEFWFKGANNDLVQGWLLKPVNFDSTKKYPLAFLIHGGPQGGWDDSFGFRWNPQVYAGAGYAVVAINFHGSTGYGEKFQLAVSKNWGNDSYKDLMKGLDYALRQYKFINSKKLCALGASYGGYMINWINGHTDRFNCLINHDGMFDSINSFYTTDELFFNEYEFAGVPWDKEARKIYDKFNPREYVQNWKTPTLVIHGGKDYRLVDAEGFSTFTALQRLGVPSRLLYFPDENHWVLKQANLLFWFQNILEWMETYTADN